MDDSEKTKAQLIEELEVLRAKVAGSRPGTPAEGGNEASGEETQFLNAVFDSMRDTVFVFDPSTGQAIRWNRAFREASGYTDEEIAARRAPDSWYSEEDLHRAVKATREVADTGETHIELSLLTKNGKKVPTEYIAGLLGGADGHRQLAVSIGRDITERKRMEGEFRIFKTISDRAGYGAAIIDLHGRLTYVNAAFAKMHHYSAAELLGKHFSILHTEEQMRNVTRLKDLLEQTGSYVAEEVWHQRRDGTVFPALMTGCAIPGDNGQPLCLSSTIVDITEHQRAEEALRESEKNFAEAQRVAHVGSWDLDVTTGRLSWSDESYRIFGFKPGEFTPTYERFTAIVHPDDQELVQEHVDASLNGDVEYHIDFRFVGPDGKIGWTHCDGEVTRDRDGRPIRFFGTQINITELKQAAAALRDKEELFARAFHGGPHMMSISSLEDGVYLEVNDNFVTTTGFSREEAIGQTSTGLGIVKAEDREHFRQLVSADGTAEGVELTLRKRSGEPFSARYWGRPISIGGQQRLFSVVEETTKQAHVEAERDKLQQQLLQSQKLEAVGTLAGGVAHDMNNVLAVVLGLGSVLAREMGPSDPKSHDIQEILSAARRGKSLVENLLGFARKGNYQRERACLNDTVRQLIEVLAHSIPKKVAVTTCLDAQLAEIECDPAQIMQTLLNICLNANDAIDGSGTITISTSNEVLGASDVAGLDPGRYVNLQIGDNGTGMHKETKRKAFEPFFTTKGIGEGTGLGLSMAYGVVKDHGGAIQIDSNPGVGTAINIRLPAVALEEAKEPQEVSEAPQTERQRGKTKLLFVDDEEMVRTAGKRMLEAAGCDVILADSGSFALDAYRNNAQDVDLVVLDLSMPVMDGAECFEQLKDIDTNVRVLICTGHAKCHEIEEMIAHGALGVVKKPFDLEQLSEAIEEALGNPQAVENSE